MHIFTALETGRTGSVVKSASISDFCMAGEILMTEQKKMLRYDSISGSI